MRINHNVSAMVGHGAIAKIGRDLGKSIEKLSTGLRINRASDDAAGLSVSENLRAQVRGTHMAIRNSNDAISALQIADGAANEISDMLQRMRELAVQSASETLTTTERTYLESENAALIAEIDRIAGAAEYNGSMLIDGSADITDIHIGPNDTDTLDISAASGTDMTASGLGVDGVDISDAGDAATAIGTIDTGIDALNSSRSEIGAMVNRLEHTVNHLYNSVQNLQAAESGIRDVDFAVETTHFTRNSILTQSATAMLAQANMVPQNALALFG